MFLLVERRLLVGRMAEVGFFTVGKGLRRWYIRGRSVVTYVLGSIPARTIISGFLLDKIIRLVFASRWQQP